MLNEPVFSVVVAELIVMMVIAGAALVICVTVVCTGCLCLRQQVAFICRYYTSARFGIKFTATFKTDKLSKKHNAGVMTTGTFFRERVVSAWNLPAEKLTSLFLVSSNDQ